MKERIQIIQQQEETLDKMESLITEFEAVAEKWQQLQPDYIKLIEYYDSKQWIKDYDSSNIRRIATHKVWCIITRCSI